jgi:hypothetical protein
VKKLPSLQGKDISTLTLHQLTTKTVDGKQTTELGAALDSKLPLEKAGLKNASDVVIKVAGTDSTTGEALSQCELLL